MYIIEVAIIVCTIWLVGFACYLAGLVWVPAIRTWCQTWCQNNFNTSTLWQNQQTLINNLLNIAPVDHTTWAHLINLLRGNIFAKLAEYLAPSNLVIRNLCILDLVEGKKTRIKRLQRQFDYLLAANGIWKEGYSYWSQDIRPILEKYSPEMIIHSLVERAFIRTSYIANDQLWPAPYGDILYLPLDAITMSYAPKDWISAMQFNQRGAIPITAVGLNMHTNDKPFEYVYTPSMGLRIKKGDYDKGAFTFYTSESAKYPTRWIYAKALLFRAWVILRRKVALIITRSQSTRS